MQRKAKGSKTAFDSSQGRQSKEDEMSSFVLVFVNIYAR